MPARSTITGAALPHIPWEARPAGSTDVMWRYQANPVITRNLVPSANSIFNSAVIPFGRGFCGIFRMANREGKSALFSGRSTDGLAWNIQPEPVCFTSSPYGKGRAAWGL